MASGQLQKEVEVVGEATRDDVVPAKQVRTVQSVDRALRILEILAEAQGELALNEVSGRAGLNASTCHHLLVTLIARGYVGQTPRTRNYFLGSKVTQLSESRLRQFDLVDLAGQELSRLNDITLESVHLAVLQGNSLATLARFESRLPIRVGSDEVGKSNAAHATATGKAILAWLPENEIARVIAQTGLKRFTDKTITTIAELMEDLRHVRRKGYAVDDQEFQPGVMCIGAAIRDHAGAVRGSISCSMPIMRAEGEHLEKVKAAVRDCARAVSERYGSTTDQS
jgi:IclR family acetate operon transcriptional repressor